MIINNKDDKTNEGEQFSRLHPDRNVRLALEMFQPVKAKHTHTEPEKTSIILHNLFYLDFQRNSCVACVESFHSALEDPTLIVWIQSCRRSVHGLCLLTRLSGSVCQRQHEWNSLRNRLCLVEPNYIGFGKLTLVKEIFLSRWIFWEDVEISLVFAAIDAKKSRLNTSGILLLAEANDRGGGGKRCFEALVLMNENFDRLFRMMSEVLVIIGAWCKRSSRWRHWLIESSPAKKTLTHSQLITLAQWSFLRRASAVNKVNSS